MYAANPLDRGRLLYAPSTTVHDPNPPLNLETPSAGGSVPLASLASGSSAMTGQLNLAVPLTATEAGSSTMTGTESTAFSLAATSAGSSTLTGALRIDRVMAGTMAAGATMTGSASLAFSLGGTSAGTSVMTGALFFGLGGQMIASSAMTGGLTVQYALAGADTGGSIMGDTTVPDPVLYPDVTLFPGSGTARMFMSYALGGTSAGTSSMSGGYTDLAATSAGASAMGAPQVPSLDVYPSVGLFPGVIGGILIVEHPVPLTAADAGSSSMTGALTVQVAVGESVNIAVFIGVAIVIAVTFDDPVIESSNASQVLIGVGDG